MRNIKLVLRYDGTRYSGWQSQEHEDNTIQGKVSAVLSRITREEIRLAGSGRTDAGVHAEGQVANFKTDSWFSCGELLRDLNRYLPEDIAVLSAVEQELDERAMEEAAALLCGTHDFRAFSSYRRGKKSTVRTLETIEFERRGAELRISFTGNGFLYHMVRILTGTLIEVGLHKKRPEEMTRILESLDREQAGFTAPAQGLCLLRVEYP